MFGVTHKHRFFRLQVLATLVVSLGLILSGYAHGERMQVTALPQGYFTTSLFTWVPILSGAVFSVFLHGRLRFRALMLGAILSFAAVWSVFLVDLGVKQETWMFLVRAVGLLALGGVFAWCGKLLALYLLGAVMYAYWQNSIILVGLAPVFATLGITGSAAQWAVLATLAITSFLADI